MYLSALLALKKGESQDQVVNLLNKTVELHLGAVRVCSFVFFSPVSNLFLALAVSVSETVEAEYVSSPVISILYLFHSITCTETDLLCDVSLLLWLRMRVTR